MLYETLPPETNSANIEMGPGPNSMLAAAQAWERVAKEMSSEVFEPFRRVLDELLEAWSGQSAMRITETTAPFLKWLIELEKQLKVAHEQTTYLRMVYGLARRAIVPRQNILDNRAERDKLVTTKEFGLDSNEIAELDRVYQNYWVQDTNAMRNYHNVVRQALSTMTAWQPPPPIVNETGLAHVGATAV